MKRSDIQVIARRSSITILTKDNQMTFSPVGNNIAMSCTAEITMLMLDELEKSKIIEVESYIYSEGFGAIKIYKKFGFTNEKFTDLLIDLIEKYNL